MVGRVRGRWAKAGIAAACVAVLGMGLGACTPEEEPTPPETTYRVTERPSTETVTPTPTETPTLTPEEVNIEGAKQTVVEYSAAVDAVGAASFVGWQEALVKYWGTFELTDYWGVTYSQAEADGLRTEGAVVLESIEASEYRSDPGTTLPSVRVTYCEDNSSIDVLLPDGSLIPKSGLPRVEWQTRLTLREDGSWVFIEMTQNSTTPC